MVIQIDTREKQKHIEPIKQEFDRRKIKHFSSKLYVGDYMSLDKPRLSIDRKQNLLEVYTNVISDNKRFTAELKKAKEVGITLLVLVEHGYGIKTLSDVQTWENPRIRTYKEDLKARLQTVEDLNEYDLYKLAKEKKIDNITKPPVDSIRLYKIIKSIENTYNTKFLFCDKNKTADAIIKLLS